MPTKKVTALIVIIVGVLGVGLVATVREFLEADLIDAVHVAVAPVGLGRGERLWGSPDEPLDRFHRETIPSPSGVIHQLFWRR